VRGTRMRMNEEKEEETLINMESKIHKKRIK
jgi:hypothetical protein